MLGGGGESICSHLSWSIRLIIRFLRCHHHRLPFRGAICWNGHVGLRLSLTMCKKGLAAAKQMIAAVVPSPFCTPLRHTREFSRLGAPEALGAASRFNSYTKPEKKYSFNNNANIFD